MDRAHFVQNRIQLRAGDAASSITIEYAAVTVTLRRRKQAARSGRL